jgi:beta-lactamase regulating signal transducer with metallopeptidase domain
MMANDLVALLTRLSIAATLALLLIGLLRAPARRLVGSEAAFWLWLLVPASLIAPLLPRLTHSSAAAHSLVSLPPIRIIEVPVHFTPTLAESHYSLLATLVWLAGVTFALVYFAHCQQALKRSLGALQQGPEGTYRSTNADQPMLIGAWHCRIVLPSDFETRFSKSERTLILAHERVHIARNDALTNFIAVLVVCLFWFNPFMHWARNRFRFDQEVACDAAVLRQLKVSRRHYAKALAKSELTTAAAIGFGWARRHPLIERVAILERATPSRSRRLVGYSSAVALMLSGTYVVWAAQPDLHAPTIEPESGISINVRWFIDGAEVLSVGHGSDLRAVPMHPGVGFYLLASPFSSRVQYLLTCVPSLDTSDPGRPGSPDIVMKCEIGRDGGVLATPTVKFHIGESATIEMTDAERNAFGRIEIGATDRSHPERLTINFQDAGIEKVIAAVALATHKTFVIDPRVHFLVTMHPATPLSPDQFYQAFLGILRENHFVAELRPGDTIQVTPEVNAN